jgi:hypothetical protein
MGVSAILEPLVTGFLESNGRDQTLMTNGSSPSAAAGCRPRERLVKIAVRLALQLAAA